MAGITQPGGCATTTMLHGIKYVSLMEVLVAMPQRSSEAAY
jgi:hypothetical protein